MMEQRDPVSFVEMAKFVKEKGTWFYLSGKLAEVDGQW